MQMRMERKPAVRKMAAAEVRTGSRGQIRGRTKSVAKWVLGVIQFWVI